MQNAHYEICRPQNPAGWDSCTGGTVSGLKGLRFNLNVLRVGVSWRDRGSLLQAEGPKMEKEREPTVESLDHGILRLKLKACDVEWRGRLSN